MQLKAVEARLSDAAGRGGKILYEPAYLFLCQLARHLAVDRAGDRGRRDGLHAPVDKRKRLTPGMVNLAEYFRLIQVHALCQTAVLSICSSFHMPPIHRKAIACFIYGIVSG